MICPECLFLYVEVKDSWERGRKRHSYYICDKCGWGWVRKEKIPNVVKKR